MQRGSLLLVMAAACWQKPSATTGSVTSSVMARPQPRSGLACAFVSARDSENHWSNAQIYLVDGVHRIPVNLTNDAQTNWAPAISPDGREMVFVASRGHGLFVLELETDESREVPIATPGQPASPRWLSGHRIAYAAFTDRTAVWLVDMRGDSPRQLTSPGPKESDDGGFAMIDGGKRIVFSRYDRLTGERHLYVANTDGSDSPIRITNTSKVSETLPTVSHEGQLLAFRRFAHTDFSDQIRIVSTRDFSLVRDISLASPAKWNINGLDFTGDDRQIVFGADADDVGGNLQNLHGELFVVGVDGGNQRRLTKNAAYDGQPACMPAVISK
ncbi:MAG TPA: hypothetical protein VFV99_18100 [Kofleriaceae bacterium]|nr:hypothetical protein [Kofleriaceae bacterium]